MSNKNEDKYKCPACDQYFNYHELLISHIQLHCNKSFCNKLFLQNHMMIHTELLIFKCNKYDNSFSSKIQFHKHEERYHSDKNNKCNICNMILVDNTSLNRHMSTHQKELLFNCQFCEKKFSSYKSRWYHLKKDHKQDHHSRSHLKLKPKYNILESTNIAKILLKVVNNN
jgi:KRAB domain-containing zinc finger protein